MTESNKQIEKLKKQIEDDSSKEHHYNKETCLKISALLPEIILVVILGFLISNGILFTTSAAVLEIITILLYTLTAILISKVMLAFNANWVYAGLERYF